MERLIKWIGKQGRKELTIEPPYTMRTPKKEIRRKKPLMAWAVDPVRPVLSMNQ